MRLGDLDDLKNALEVTQYNDIDDLTRTERLIDNAPTVEAKTTADCIIAYGDGYETARRLSERPQGEWLKAQGEWVTDTTYKICFECSECKAHLEFPFNFCPVCGAKMKGGA